MTKKQAIIIGGGHNGLVAANYLAQAGVQVLVLERRDMVGGACITEELFPGYRVSSCSYISHLLQDKVVDDLELRKHGLKMHLIDPYRFQPFPNGRAMLTWRDHERTAAEAARIHKPDGQGVLNLYAFWEKAAGLLHKYFLQEPPTRAGIAAALAGTPDEAILHRLYMGNLVDVVNEHLESDEVRATFLDAQDAGDPYAPGSVMAAAYIMCNLFTDNANVGIPYGGMGGITQAMARSAESKGVSIRTGVEVSKVRIEQGRAVGVTLADGEELDADVVLSNADPKRTFLTLVSEGDLPYGFVEGVRKLKTNVGYLKFHAALSGLPDFTRFLGDRYDPKHLAQIRISPSVEYFERAWRDASEGHIAKKPVMHVQIPSVYDDTMTQPGKHVMSVWGLYAPVHPSEGTWDELREQAGQSIIEGLSEYAPNFKDVLVDWQVFTPLDLERERYLTDGNIRHLDMVADQMLSKRPGYRTPVVGLYLCGAGTHPGGEVTGAPGHNAAQVVLRDLKLA